PVQGDDRQREQDLVPQVGDPEHVPEAGQHGCSPSATTTDGAGRPMWRPGTQVLPLDDVGAQLAPRRAARPGLWSPRRRPAWPGGTSAVGRLVALAGR